MVDDESGGSIEPMREVPLVGLGESELEISVWLMERSRELIPNSHVYSPCVQLACSPSQ